MSTNQKHKPWIQVIAEKAVSVIAELPGGAEVEVYLDSEICFELSTLASVRIKDTDFLLIVSEEQADYGFIGESTEIHDHIVMLCPENAENVSVLRKLFPYTNPSVIGKTKSTFGVGDRLGIAGPGHLRVFKENDVVPVMAQQSLRELELTGRTYADVIDAASWAVFKSGYKRPWAADGDHLKHMKDVSSAVRQGCTMITADLSDHIDFSIPDRSLAEISELYEKLDAGYRNRVEEAYAGKIILTNGVCLEYNGDILAAVVLTYMNAVEHAETLFNAAIEHRDSLDFEISIDETSLPTTLEAHYFVARELEYLGVKYTSIAPRFVGEFQKGIDYIGNTEAFEVDYKGHADIAADLGYKISIHSSSDKFSVYPIMAVNSPGPFHLKTSGTNWLVALEVVAENEPELFREVFDYAYKVFPVTGSYYHVTPDFGIKTDLEDKKNNELISVFDNPTDRQVLHVSYGEVFKDIDMKHRLFNAFNMNITDYWDRLEKHIGRHVRLLDK